MKLNIQRQSISCLVSRILRSGCFDDVITDFPSLSGKRPITDVLATFSAAKRPKKCDFWSSGNPPCSSVDTVCLDSSLLEVSPSIDSTSSKATPSVDMGRKSKGNSQNELGKATSKSDLVQEKAKRQLEVLRTTPGVIF